MAFYRLVFFAESPDTPWPANPAEYTGFSVIYATKRAIDLTRGQYTVDRARRMHATDYTHCQSFADVARLAKVEVIRYASVRDPRQGINLALLTCQAFTKHQPIDQQTWRIHLSEAGVQAIRESPKFGITFDRKAFADDLRITKLRWIRA